MKTLTTGVKPDTAEHTLMNIRAGLFLQRVIELKPPKELMMQEQENLLEDVKKAATDNNGVVGPLQDEKFFEREVERCQPLLNARVDALADRVLHEKK